MVDSSPVFPHPKSSFSVQGFIRIVRNPCGFKVGNPQVFRFQASCNWEPQFVADHINGHIVKNCIGEPWNPAQLPKQPPSLDGG